MNSDRGYRPGRSRRGEGIRKLLGRLASWKRARRFPGTTARQAGTVTRAQQSWKLRRIARLVLLALVSLVAGSALVTLGWRQLTGSDLFTLARISVQGNKMLSELQVIDQADLERGKQLFRLDREAVEKKLEEHPWISGATVQIRWPSEMVLSIREHRPLALIPAGEQGQLFYVDKDGVVFAPVAPGQDIDFPVLSGNLVALGLNDGVIRGDSLAGMGLLVLQLATKGNAQLLIQDISEVHVSAEHGVILFLVEHPFPVYLGHEQVRERYNRLVLTLERLYRKKQIEPVKAIRMDYGDDRALVRGLAADAGQASEEKSSPNP